MKKSVSVPVDFEFEKFADQFPGIAILERDGRLFFDDTTEQAVTDALSQFDPTKDNRNRRIEKAKAFLTMTRQEFDQLDPRDVLWMVILLLRHLLT